MARRSRRDDGRTERRHAHVEQHPYFNPECECFVALILNSRRKVKGHYLVSVGIQDTILVHLAMVTAASAVVLLHNHPSGEYQVALEVCHHVCHFNLVTNSGERLHYHIEDRIWNRIEGRAFRG